MEFSIQRETLLTPLQLISGAVEKKQTLPILSNVLLSLEDQMLCLTATDLEVELIGRVNLIEPVTQSGRITVPARKLADICKTLPEDQLVNIVLDKDRLLLKSGRSRFVLATLSADDFPAVEEEPAAHNFTISEHTLRYLIEKTHFSMAQQDVRYYLNGILFHVNNHLIEMVATDGHRLAQGVIRATSIGIDKDIQVIIPRKAIMELMRLLTNSDNEVTVHIGEHHIRVMSPAFTFTSKLIEGRFPDYNRVIPKSPAHTVLVNRHSLKQALTRVAILSHDKYRGVRLVFEDNILKIFAHNSEKETAEDELTIDFSHAAQEVGFNVNYIQDVLAAIDTETVRLSFTDGNNSVLIEASAEGEDRTADTVYVIMPMRL